MAQFGQLVRASRPQTRRYINLRRLTFLRYGAIILKCELAKVLTYTCTVGINCNCTQQNACITTVLLTHCYFTVRRSALHGLCDRNSVCPSVRHTRGLCPHGWTDDHDFFTIW